MIKPLYAVFFALLLLCGLSACSKPETALPVQTTVLILGDSLTQGVGASSAQTNYPALLKQQSQWNIINGGVSGNTSAQALARLPELLQQHQPKLVIISIGGNDFLQRLSNSDTQANIAQSIALSQQSGAQVLLVAVPELTLAAAVGIGANVCGICQRFSCASAIYTGWRKTGVLVRKTFRRRGRYDLATSLRT